MTPNLTVKTYTPGLTGWANLASEIQEVMDRAWRNGIEIQERERKRETETETGGGGKTGTERKGHRVTDNRKRDRRKETHMFPCI